MPGKSKFQRQCGEILVVELEDLSSSLVQSGSCSEEEVNVKQVAPPLYSKKKSYQTKKSLTSLGVPTETLSLSKSVQDVINNYLLQLVEKKVKENFAEAFAFASKENNPELNEAIQDAQRAVFEKGSGRAVDKIRKYLALFPAIEAQLLVENPELKPLFCQYEVWKHRMGRWKKVAKILGRISSIGGYAGIIASAILALPTLPAVIIGVGALKVASSGIGLTTNILSMSEYSAGTAAKMVLRFQNEIKTQLEELSTQRQSASSQERVEINQRMKDLEKAGNEIEVHKKELEVAVDGRATIRKEVISNLLNMSLGVFMIKAGVRLNAKFKDFNSSSADSQNPMPDTPDTDYSGGGISPDQ